MNVKEQILKAHSQKRKVVKALARRKPTSSLFLVVHDHSEIPKVSVCQLENMDYSVTFNLVAGALDLDSDNGVPGNVESARLFAESALNEAVA